MIELTLTEQKLIVSMLKEPVNFKNQDVYKHKTSFYKAIWKLRDNGLAIVDRVNGNGTKHWSHTTDGFMLATILAGGDNAQS